MHTMAIRNNDDRAINNNNKAYVSINTRKILQILCDLLQMAIIHVYNYQTKT